ncbi:QueT transporter family protein [Peribacillus sp. B-H-3]|uniref:QueT transporter family protein n=1 Tax=Peribacillus sp. B-H-3 TaxID=3400420 RepID=UPI003B015C25
MNIKPLVANSILAALYIAVSMAIAPFGFGSIQFRISEMFNHLVVFNKKFFPGIVLGVIITNFFSPTAAYDLIFGVGQSVISLLIAILTARFVKNVLLRMFINTIVFTITMFLIALELHLAIGLPFLLTWLTTAAGEFAVMLAGIPVMLSLNMKVNFNKLIERK